MTEFRRCIGQGQWLQAHGAVWQTRAGRRYLKQNPVTGSRLLLGPARCCRALDVVWAHCGAWALCISCWWLHGEHYGPDATDCLKGRGPSVCARDVQFWDTAICVVPFLLASRLPSARLCSDEWRTGDRRNSRIVDTSCPATMQDASCAETKQDELKLLHCWQNISSGSPQDDYKSC